jgi:hypothetical protein
MKKVVSILCMAAFLAVSVPYVSASVNHQDKTTSVAKKHKKPAEKKAAQASSTSASTSTPAAAKAKTTPASTSTAAPVKK